MDKITNYLLQIIRYGESVTTEFKEARTELPKNLFETVCAFLNRNGGHIFLGISDKREIIGVKEENISAIKKNFINLCNNPEKINPTIYLNIKEYEINGKYILHVYVHESSMVHKTKGIIFDRNQDGDYKVTISERIANIYARKQNFYTENKVFPYAQMSDLRSDLIKKARKMAINNCSKTHAWSCMSDEEMLRSMNLIERDLNTGKEGITLAAILLFGKDTTILSVLPHHKTDAIYRIKNVDRYDDRDDIRTNLIESFERLVAFVEKHLDDKFYIEGAQRIDVRNKIARELCVNTLIHREFSNPYPAKLIIEKDCLRTENANKAKMIGNIDIECYEPYPKNPKIAKFFKEIGLADELGSGVKNMVKYTKIYSNCIPEFKEDDIFRTKIPLINNYELINADKTPINADKTPITNSELERLIIEYLGKHKYITNKQVKDMYNVKDTRSKLVLRNLVLKNILLAEGANKNRIYILKK